MSMKVKIEFLVLALIIFTSCKAESHKEIRDAFRQYVIENFGNPKDMKEITSVELTDTTSFDEFKNIAIQTLAADSIVDKRQNNVMKWLNSDGINRMGKLKYSYRDEFLNLIGKISDNVYSYYKSQALLASKIEDNKNVSEYFIHYVLKARIEVNGIKEVREYHAYVDKNGKIDIKDRTMKKSELPEYWTDLGETTLSLANASTERAKNLNRLKDMLLSSGIDIDGAGF